MLKLPAEVQQKFSHRLNPTASPTAVMPTGQSWLDTPAFAGPRAMGFLLPCRGQAGRAVGAHRCAAWSGLDSQCAVTLPHLLAVIAVGGFKRSDGPVSPITLSFPAPAPPPKGRFGEAAFTANAAREKVQDMAWGMSRWGRHRTALLASLLHHLAQEQLLLPGFPRTATQPVLSGTSWLPSPAKAASPSPCLFPHHKIPPAA